MTLPYPPCHKDSLAHSRCFCYSLNVCVPSKSHMWKSYPPILPPHPPALRWGQRRAGDSGETLAEKNRGTRHTSGPGPCWDLRSQKCHVLGCVFLKGGRQKPQCEVPSLFPLCGKAKDRNRAKSLSHVSCGHPLLGPRAPGGGPPQPLNSSSPAPSCLAAGAAPAEPVGGAKQMQPPGPCAQLGTSRLGKEFA